MPLPVSSLPPDSPPSETGTTTASGIVDAVNGRAVQLGVAQRGPFAGALLEPADERGQSLGGESRARHLEDRDGSLDALGRPFDLDEPVHSRVLLEPDDGSVELVLHDLAVDRACHDEADVTEDRGERIRIRHRSTELLAHLVAVLVVRRSLPPELGLHTARRTIDPGPQHMIARRKPSLGAVVSAVLEPACVDESRSSALEARTARIDIIDDALQLDFAHQGLTMEATTAEVSVRSAKTAAGPCVRSSSIPYRPVATPIALAPMDRPQAMSAGVSPMTTMLCPATSLPNASAARRCAMAGSSGRSSWSDPYAPTRNREGSMPTARSLPCAPTSRFPVSRPSMMSSRASRASSSSVTPS